MQIKNKNGFSLVELMTVVAVIGVMALFAIPQLTNVKPNMRLQAVARDLYSNSQKTRILAVKSNRDTAIIFNTGTDDYTICDDWDIATQACVGATQLVALSTATYGIGYGHGNGVLGATQANTAADAFPLAPDDDVSYTTPTNTVVFNAQGLISNAGYVYLDHNRGDKTYAVSCQTSGVIKLLRWNAGGWE